MFIYLSIFGFVIYIYIYIFFFFFGGGGRVMQDPSYVQVRSWTVSGARYSMISLTEGQTKNSRVFA